MNIRRMARECITEHVENDGSVWHDIDHRRLLEHVRLFVQEFRLESPETGDDIGLDEAKFGAALKDLEWEIDYELRRLQQ